MEKKRFWMGMLAMVLAFGMVIVGCGDGGGGGKEEAVSLPSTSGEFTLTDIPSQYNGKFVILEGIFSDSPKSLIGWKSVTRNSSNPNYASAMTGVKIENGTVKIPLYTFSNSSPLPTLQAYTGNDLAFVQILVYNTDKVLAENINSFVDAVVFGTVSSNTPTSFPVQFTSGKATKSNNDATVKLKGDSTSGNGKKLTITGITGISGTVTVLLGEEGDNFVAGGSGTISNNSVTIALKVLNTQNYTLSGDWKGDGPCGIVLWNKAIPGSGFESMGEPQYILETLTSFAEDITTVSWSNFSAYDD